MSGGNYLTACVQFVWKYARGKGKYGLGSLDSRQMKILERKLRDYEKHDCTSFSYSNGVDLREVDIGKWKNAPSEHQQRQVKEEVSVDIPEPGPVLRFRVSGRMRVLGYMDRNKFFVVWVDARHEMGG